MITIHSRYSGLLKQAHHRAFSLSSGGYMGGKRWDLGVAMAVAFEVYPRPLQLV